MDWLGRGTHVSILTGGSAKTWDSLLWIYPDVRYVKIIWAGGSARTWGTKDHRVWSISQDVRHMKPDRWISQEVRHFIESCLMDLSRHETRGTSYLVDLSRCQIRYIILPDGFIKTSATRHHLDWRNYVYALCLGLPSWVFIGDLLDLWLDLCCLRFVRRTLNVSLHELLNYQNGIHGLNWDLRYSEWIFGLLWSYSLERECDFSKREWQLGYEL